MASGSILGSHRNHPHNAHCFEAVTLYYRWHPLFGLSLPVRKRRRTRDGQQVFCQAPDGTFCSVPDWMLRPECAQFSLGAPLISVEALAELHRVLVAVQIPSDGAKALLQSSAKEEGHETIGEATHRADESTPSGSIGDGSGRQAKGVGTNAHGNANQRGPRKRAPATIPGRRR